VNLEAGSNLHWSLSDGATFYRVIFFSKIPRREDFCREQNRALRRGWSVNDQFADPKFVNLNGNPSQPLDVRTEAGEPGD